MAEYRELEGVKIATGFGQAKIRWYEDGQKYALRLSKEDFEKLKVEEGHIIPILTVENTNDG